MAQEATDNLAKHKTANSNVSKHCHYDMDMAKIIKSCTSFQRIALILKTYEQLRLKMQTRVSTQNATIFDIIESSMGATYDHQQLFDDFLHVKIIHIDADNDKIRSHDHLEYAPNHLQRNTFNDIGRKMSNYFVETIPCKNISGCTSFSRHYRDRDIDATKQMESTMPVEDAAFLQECDKIHIFFLHSTIQFGIKFNQTTTAQEEMIDEINRYAKGRSYSRERYAGISAPYEDMSVEPKLITQKSKVYTGSKEDNEWWSHVEAGDSKQNEQDIYVSLVQKMGIFRWQNPHGFEVCSSQETSHYKPIFKNLKEEALNNPYAPMTKDNWNQTLRKSKIFHNSWAGTRIQTKFNGSYNDQVTGHKADWNEDTKILLPEVVTLKLYTDFDKLQFELKKCFRFETFQHILQQKRHPTDSEIIAETKKYEVAKQQLEYRLKNFYHWRGLLLIILNKFGTKLNTENNMILYHGVNKKMIISPSQKYAFHGPLSTTSSYHVARTFATAKGMVLKITSHFPRLNYCNAFDASLISDYPEEQEWLVGFMYLRVLKMRTRKLIDDLTSWEALVKKCPISSWVKQQFFAVHLFGQHMFSMSEHLERILAQFLKVNRYECCKLEQREKY
eukprot:385374_1